MEGLTMPRDLGMALAASSSAAFSSEALPELANLAGSESPVWQWQCRCRWPWPCQLFARHSGAPPQRRHRPTPPAPPASRGARFSAEPLASRRAVAASGVRAASGAAARQMRRTKMPRPASPPPSRQGPKMKRKRRMRTKKRRSSNSEQASTLMLPLNGMRPRQCFRRATAEVSWGSVPGSR